LLVWRPPRGDRGEFIGHPP